MSPVPTFVKNNVVEFLQVSAIPTNVPVVPSPTLTVDNPIKLLSILATNNFSPSAKVVPIPTLG